MDHQIVARRGAADAVHRQRDAVVEAGQVDRVVAGRNLAVIVDRRRQRVAVVHRATGAGAGVAGQRQHAFTGVDHAVGRAERLDLRPA